MYTPLALRQRVMVEHGVKDGNYVAQMPFILRETDISTAQIQQVVERLAQENPVLRSKVFKDKKHGLLQGVYPAPRMTVLLPENVAEKQLPELMAQDRLSGFEQQESWLRLTVAKLSNHSVFFMMTTHHALVDGWGQQFLYQRLFAYLNELQTGKQFHPEDSSLSSPENVFKDYVANQHKLKSDTEYQARLDKLAKGFSDTMPAEITNSSSEAANLCNHLEFALPWSTWKQATDAAKHSEITEKSLLLSVWSQVLMQHCQHNEILMGVVSNGRTPEIAGSMQALGLFWHMAPINLAAKTEDIANIEYTRAVNRQLLERELEGAWVPATYREPAIAASLNFKKFSCATTAQKNIEGLHIESLPIRDRFHYPINLAMMVDEQAQTVKCALEFNTQYFVIQDAQALTQEILEKLSTFEHQQ